MNCIQCGASLPDQDGVGRPRKYCSKACSKAATKEIRRLDARLARLGDLESQYRIARNARWAASCAEEIERLETRMRELLDAGEEEHADVCTGNLL